MTDVAASDFRLPHRYVRLDTILRLRWLAALGQLTAIFIVAQGLEFAFPTLACVAIVGVSALLNLALQTAFNPMQRLEPVYAAALLALNIVELAALLFLTGGLQNPFSFLFLGPVLISATVLPIRLTIGLGLLAVACASALVFFHLPLPWDSETRWYCRLSICSGSGSRSCSRSASPVSMRSRRPRKRASFPMRWLRPSWC
jgi:two-component system sensor histidine kinase RegB